MSVYEETKYSNARFSHYEAPVYGTNSSNSAVTMPKSDETTTDQVGYGSCVQSSVTHMHRTGLQKAWYSSRLVVNQRCFVLKLFILVDSTPARMSFEFVKNGRKNVQIF